MLTHYVNQLYLQVIDMTGFYMFMSDNAHYVNLASRGVYPGFRRGASNDLSVFPYENYKRGI